MPSDKATATDATNEADQIANNDPQKVQKLANIGKDGDAVEEAEDE